MTTTTNAENLRQYKSRFSLIVQQILVFPFITNLIREVKDVLLNMIEHDYICCETNLVINGRF